jgi:O-antigen ligase
LDFPVFGAGLAAFGNIFSMYNTSYPGLLITDAHSDWVGILSEVGLAGFLCILIFIWAFFKDILYCHFLGRGSCTFKALLKGQTVGLRHDRFILIILLAGFSSLTSIILHGIFETNLHIPSNFFLTVIIGAVLISAIHNISSEKNQVN